MIPRLRLLRVALLAVLFTTLAIACARKDSLDPSTMPVGIRDDYPVFARKCSKCHSLARPLTANITDDEQWGLYVTRMRRQPQSGISPADQEVILRFLRWYAADLRQKQAEKNQPPAPANVPVLAADGGAP